MIERFDMPELKDSFIGAWMMSDEITEPIVNFWSNPEVNSRATPGALGAKSTRNKYRKDSMEVAIHPDDYSGPWKKYRNALGRCVDDYRLKQYPDANEVEPFAVVERFNLQWYPPGGGFFVEHCENTGSKNSVYRHLVFMTYLNNVQPIFCNLVTRVRTQGKHSSSDTWAGYSGCHLCIHSQLKFNSQTNIFSKQERQNRFN